MTLLHGTFRVVVTFAFLATALTCLANDEVNVRYESGYPHPSLSSEFLTLSVVRSSSYTREREVEVDKFFLSVQKALTKNKVTSSWERVLLHAPTARVEIKLDGKTIMLVSSFLEKGTAIPLEESETDRRHRLAFEEILRLTVDRTRTRLSPQ